MCSILIRVADGVSNRAARLGVSRRYGHSHSNGAHPLGRVAGTVHWAAQPGGSLADEPSPVPGAALWARASAFIESAAA